MKKKRKKKVSSKFIGKAPAEVIYLGDKEHLDIKIEIFDYTKDDYTQTKINTISDIVAYIGNEHITWININGLSNIKEIIEIGKHFNLHPLIVEDIVDTGQRPKIDEYENYLFIVMKMLYFDENNSFVTEHISIVLGEDYVLTFQESDEDIFGAIRKRLQNQLSKIRNSKADYLAFSLMDAIVDNYFTITDNIGEKVEAFEDELFMDHVREDITVGIQSLKHSILRSRRSISPSKEIITRIVESKSQLIDHKTKTYYRDLQDHILLINENIDVFREMIWGLMDMYMTTMSHKMNSVMKVLTIIATIFIPLTFIVGVYGMNFQHMPELSYKYGYYGVWGIMILIVFVLILYFKKKKWL